MKLTVDTLDNDVNSAVIDIGKNNGYVEVFVANGIVHLNVFNKQGDAVHHWAETTKNLRKENLIEPDFYSGELIKHDPNCPACDGFGGRCVGELNKETT
jgi:uncharacterized protein YheU (UPF0270 family)